MMVVGMMLLGLVVIGADTCDNIMADYNGSLAKLKQSTAGRLKARLMTAPKAERDTIEDRLNELGGEPAPATSLAILESTAASISLTKLKPIQATTGAWGLLVDKHPEGKKPIVGREVKNMFIVAHAPSLVQYKIPAGVVKFEAAACSLGWPKGRVAVKIDDRTVYEGKPFEEIADGVDMVSVEVPAGAKTITLIGEVTTPGGDNTGCHVTWAEPRFIKKR